MSTRRRRRLRLRRLAPDVRSTSGNALELYVDGASGLRAMLEAIAGARRYIHLETYILRADATGRGILAALAERARAGVAVRVLYDAVGSIGLDPSAFEELRKAGGEPVAFNPLTRLVPRWAPRWRDHRKILVIDGGVAFTGGLNIGDEYVSGLGGRPAGEWRDAHVRVTGPAVQELEAVFLESWFRADGPDDPPTSPPSRAAAATGGSSVAVVADGPTYRRRRMRQLLLDAFGRARRCVRLATPYFGPDRRLREGIEEAARRGVQVDLLIAGASDHPLLRWAARALLPPLLAEGVRVFEYEHAMMHAKAAVFDDEWAIIGTSNLDRQSLQHSYEVNLVVQGGGFPDRLSRVLEADTRAARQISAEAIQARRWPERLRDRLAASLLLRV